MLLRHFICLAITWSVSAFACSADFSGVWKHSYKDEVLNAELMTIITLVQRGEKVCGEWIEINYRGMELTANVVGLAKGNFLQLKTDGLSWGGDSPFDGDPAQEQFKLIHGGLFQLNHHNGQLPTKDDLAAGMLMKLSKSTENPVRRIGEESLTKCFNGPTYQSWNPSQK